MKDKTTKIFFQHVQQYILTKIQILVDEVLLAKSWRILWYLAAHLDSKMVLYLFQYRLY